MGRQAYLARLALGRGAFQTPELDDDGNFILGPYAHDFENSDGYVQEWDHRGHPQNKRSKTQARDFRRAQNEVLEIVGVVEREREMSKTAWERQTEEEKIQAIMAENEAGDTLSVVASNLLFGSTWWIHSLRHQVQTYRSISSIPLLGIMSSELRVLGPWTFFSTGLPQYYIGRRLGDKPQDEKDQAYKREDKLDKKKSLDLTQRRSGSRLANVVGISKISSYFAWSLLALPIKMKGLLKGLRLIPPSQTTLSTLYPNLWFLNPFSSESPLRFPALPTTFSVSNTLAFASDLIRSPPILALLHEFLGLQIEAALYFIIRWTVSSPDRQDNISLHAATKQELDSVDLPALVGQRGTSTFRWILTPLRWHVPLVYKPIILIGRWLTSRDVSLIPMSEGQKQSLKIKATQYYRSILRKSRRREHSLDADDLMQIGTKAIACAFINEGINEAPTYYIDLDEWRSQFPDPDEIDDESTATPDQEDLFLIDDLDRPETNPAEEATDPGEADRAHIPESVSAEGPTLRGGENIASPDIDANPGDLADGIHEVIIPRMYHLPMSLSPPQSPAVVSHPTSPIDHRHSREENPSPGITRAQSLALHDVFDGQSSEDSYRQIPHPDRNRTRSRSPKGAFHRVTLLSNLPADLFASAAAQVLTTIIMLPIESMYIRSLAHGFLSSPGERPAAAQLLGDVRGVDEWLGTPGGRMGYAANLALCIGLQTAVSAVVWAGISMRSVKLGRLAGWGQF